MIKSITMLFQASSAARSAYRCVPRSGGGRQLGLMLYPRFWLVSSSFKPNDDIFTTVVNCSPRPLHGALRERLAGLRGVNVWSVLSQFPHWWRGCLPWDDGAPPRRWWLSALRVCTSQGRNFWFVCMVVTMMLPGQVMMIPALCCLIAGLGGYLLPLIGSLVLCQRV